jgi:hypothetical protein
LKKSKSLESSEDGFIDNNPPLISEDNYDDDKIVGSVVKEEDTMNNKHPSSVVNHNDNGNGNGSSNDDTITTNALNNGKKSEKINGSAVPSSLEAPLVIHPDNLMLTKEEAEALEKKRVERASLPAHLQNTLDYDDDDDDELLPTRDSIIISSQTIQPTAAHSMVLPDWSFMDMGALSDAVVVENMKNQIRVNRR